MQLQQHNGHYVINAVFKQQHNDFQQSKFYHKYN